MRYAMLAAILLVTGCDGGDDGNNIVTHGVQGANEARQIAGTSQEQRMAQAAQLIELGKLADAENLINQLASAQDTLSPAARERLQALRAALAKAKGQQTPD